jgi:outer membrane protein TolC
MNVKDRHEDSLRSVELAKNFLKPQLDLVANAGLNSGPARGGGLHLPSTDHYNWSAGLDLDLPFDRKSERNSYRSALIQEKRAARQVEQSEDGIRLDVRESWRTLEQAKRSYEISELGVKIAERRVEEQSILSDLGRAKAQDQVDAQNDLNSAKNARTQALVTHSIARLQFWNNMGILYIKDNGRWEEMTRVAQ